jgi:hypothetical protein
MRSVCPRLSARPAIANLAFVLKPGADQSSFSRLAQMPDLDNATAYTICRLIDSVGWAIKEDWDWNWLEKIKGGYRFQIDPSLVAPAWQLLSQKDWLSLQTISQDRISIVTPLGDMTNLRGLVLQNNRITDLKPLTNLVKLRYLNLYENRVSDLTPLAHLQSLEELHLGSNPIASMAVLEQFPKLRELFITADQLPSFMMCKRLPALQCLKVESDGSLDDLANFPEMPSLRNLHLPGLKETAGIDLLPTLTTLKLPDARFSHLDGFTSLKALTHFEIRAPGTVSLQPLGALYGLRSIKIRAPKVVDVLALARLPVLHQVRFGSETQCDQGAFESVCEGLTPWADEFVVANKDVSPSLEIEIVSQEIFDLYDSRESFGIRPGECEDGMFHSERIWLEGELTDALTTCFKEGAENDLVLPGNSGHRRSERLVLYSLKAYESCREIVTAVQQVLCQARNDWIVYFQSCLSEGPDIEDLPEGAEDFIVWIYPDRIVATEENAAVIRKLIAWR